ncbi:hypothetical protein CUU66_11560 [Peribacillus deserti]|uniref:Uncharacterized protein n=1 Tax=Peribacillus deserti TaxID=673318 RepID=A0A2N5M5V5_9BACI|nr:hypothetical protein CUU66_11560 [Peribacillus deserti]
MFSRLYFHLLHTDYFLNVRKKEHVYIPCSSLLGVICNFIGQTLYSKKAQIYKNERLFSQTLLFLNKEVDWNVRMLADLRGGR